MFINGYFIFVYSSFPSQYLRFPYFLHLHFAYSLSKYWLCRQNTLVIRRQLYLAYRTIPCNSCSLLIITPWKFPSYEISQSPFTDHIIYKIFFSKPINIYINIYFNIYPFNIYRKLMYSLIHIPVSLFTVLPLLFCFFPFSFFSAHTSISLPFPIKKSLFFF